jgi:branched-chain amino acid transport system permease protein
MIGTAVIAVIVEKLAYRPLRLKHAVPLYFMISAMGAAIFLENLVYVMPGPH